ncbi:MAG: hypothetical protein V3S14_07590 [Anaerolineae bacterium]
MNTKTRLILIVALLGIGAIVLAVALAQQEVLPVKLPTLFTPKPTPTDGEKAAAIMGQQYSNYSSTQAECEQAFESGEVEACVWPDTIQLVTRLEWEQLFPNTDFYVIEWTGRYQAREYDYYSRRRLAAWQDGQHYTADTFDELLKVNDVVITAENRELVAKALVLMTLHDYIEEDVVFYDWRREDGPWAAPLGSSDYLYYNYRITAWTKIQGLEFTWWFLFLEEDQVIRLRQARPRLLGRGVGDYIDVSYEVLPPPIVAHTYSFWGD